MWQPLIKKLPRDVRVIGIDLLGFGASPRTSWPAYQVRVQARSVAATLFLMKIRGPVIVVGHSLGSLVAIDFARRYPLMTRQLVLISPPLYDINTEPTTGLKYHPHRFLRDIHQAMTTHPDAITKLIRLATQYKLINHGFDATKVDMPTFLGTLESAIINQTSMRDLTRLRQPTTVITGKLDPFVSEQTIRRLAATHPHISHKSVVAGHEIIGLMEPAVTRAVKLAVAALS
jgi:pimeloyl-ACP methyl ester carboxylesterase